MDNITILNNLLHHVGQAIGLQSLALNDHGVASLKFGDKITLNFEPDPDHDDLCHLYSAVCRLPDNHEMKARLYEALLAANNFGRGTGGGVFSVDDQHNEVMLGRTFSPSHASSEDVTGWMKDMIQLADSWQKQLLDADYESSASPEEISEEDQQFFIKA